MIKRLITVLSAVMTSILYPFQLSRMECKVDKKPSEPKKPEKNSK